MSPRASNHTDFDVLRAHPQVDCQFIKQAADFNGADLIILPGSKSVRADMQWLKDIGWQRIIQRHLRLGGKVMGICGGFQMLGELIDDPQGIESSAGSSEGLGLLAMQTTLSDNKVLKNVSGQCLQSGAQVSGYEIHAGISEGKSLNSPLFSISGNGLDEARYTEGAKNTDDSVRGTYLHGVFDEPSMLTSLLSWAGIEEVEAFDYLDYREKEIDRLADEVEKVIPIAVIRSLLKMPEREDR